MIWKRSPTLSSSLSRPARLAWLLLLALSPAAYVVGSWLLLRNDPNMRVDFYVDRADALRRASEFAAGLGHDVEAWTRGAKVGINEDRHYYYQQQQNEESAVMRRLAPEAFIDVRFTAPDRQRIVSVTLSPEGQVLGYEVEAPVDENGVDLGESAARAAATGAFSELQRLWNLPDAPPPTTSEDREFSGVTRSYTWQVPFAALPGLETTVDVTTLGAKVVAREVKTKFDPAYGARHFVNRQSSTRLPLALWFLMVFLVACYGLYRYLRRTFQKEVPHARSLLLGAITSAAFIFIGLQTDFYAFNNANAYWVIIIVMLLFFAVLGMSMGLAYGSGEGDVREAYPGKLTSLDALLSGRLLSRNVARAVCIGTALGGWAFLAHSLLMLPWTQRPGAGIGLTKHFYEIFFGPLPWMLPLVNPPLGAVQTAVIGLLLPLSLLSRSRRLRSRGVLLVALVALSLLSSFEVFQEQTLPFAAGFLQAAARAAFILLLFFYFDLLTAIVGLSASALGIFVLYFFSQPAPSLQRAGVLAVGATLTVLLVALYYVFRGREYAEDQVRPLYARHLAERARLQAEVSAAREAQVRLLPQRRPQIAGLEVAAACLPAHEVGGDFYDFFPLDNQKLGVFVAEGGDQGLASALTIAFAKGFLMPRIAAAHTPTEIVCDLQERLVSLLGAAQGVCLAYAEIDMSARTLRYARAGGYPQFRISRDMESAAGAGNGRRFDLRPAERDARVTPDRNVACAVREALVELADGDAVVIVTDGIAKNLKSDKQQFVEEWAVEILSSRRKAAAPGALQKALDQALEQRSKRARKIGVEDDLTAVLLRLDAHDGSAAV